MGICQTVILSANLGDLDEPSQHVPQSVECDYVEYTDDNFPPRKVMTPRLQAKIPKMFGWQLQPGYDNYVWIDSNLTLTNPDSLKYFLDNLEGYDIVCIQHPRRNSVAWEARYLYRGLKEQSRYMVAKYSGEMWEDQMKEINADKDFVDDLLVLGGLFAYHDTPKVRQMFKEWWYHVSRYDVQDQISFAYVLKKFKLKVNVLPIIYTDCPWLTHRGHKRRG